MSQQNGTVPQLQLFRARMERWPDLFEYGNAALCRRQRQAPFFARDLCSPRFQTGECQPLSVEGRWLLDHLYSEALIAQFQEALERPRRMATLGVYRQGQDLQWGEHPLYAVGFRRRGCMEFRAWGPWIARDKELCEI